jgi:hypothetical protein
MGSDNKKCNGKPAKDCCNSIYHYMQPKAIQEKREKDDFPLTK